MSLDEEGKWCPRCGDQYRPGFVKCADCDVLLVDEPPEPDEPDTAGHEQLTYDLDTWTDDQVYELRTILRNLQIAHSWRLGTLTVAQVHEATVDEVIDEIDAGYPRSAVGGDASPFAEPTGPAEPGDNLASPGRRLVAYLIDGAILSLVPIVWSAAQTQSIGRPSGLAPGLVAALLGAAHQIIGVAVWGRTLGKLVTSTRVVRSDRPEVPGWRSSLIRWAAQAIVPTVATFVPIAMVGVVPVYAGVLYDRRRQGLHDRAAGTVVVLVGDPLRPWRDLDRP